MAENRLAYLFNKYVANNCTREELAELWTLMKELPEDQEILLDEMQGVWNKERPGQQAADTVDWNFLQERMKAEMQAPQPVARVRSMRRWYAAAAVILLLLAAGAFFYFNQQPTQKESTEIAEVSDIAPGKDGAILTLADGRKVVLDSLGNGIVANEKATTIVLKNGQLIYQNGQAAGDAPVYNTMHTPKGRQFQLVLPDGTKAWLNAASSIRYPTFFAGSERRVQVTGEVYLEVSPNKAMPFRVDVNDEAEIEVLGTHFNINSYSDEPSMKTTLLEGSVKVKVKQSNALAILKPGEQAQINTDHTLQTNNEVDLGKVMAWKNGFFDFENVAITEVMKQLERWYDITVVY
jgi:transmembrane sensor